MAVNIDNNVLADVALMAFSKALLPAISAFSWQAENEAVNFGDSIQVPYCEATSGSIPFTYANGYSVDTNAVTTKTVTLNNLLYQAVSVPDNAAGKLTAEAVAKMLEVAAGKLANDVISSSFSAILTDANFPTSASCNASALSSSFGWAALSKQASDAKWTGDKFAILSPTAHGYLMQNPQVINSYAYGNGTAAQDGQVGKAFGWNIAQYALDFPVTAQKTEGILVNPNAIILGISTHRPPEDSVGSGLLSCQTVQEKDTGLVLLFKKIYTPLKATTTYVIECLTGTAVGVGATACFKLK